MKVTVDLNVLLDVAQHRLPHYHASDQVRGSDPPAAEGPQFTLPIRSPHAVARTPVIPATAYDDAFVAEEWEQEETEETERGWDF